MTLRIFGQGANDSNKSDLEERFEQFQETTGTTDREDRFFQATVEEETTLPTRRRFAPGPEGLAEATAGDLLDQFAQLANDNPAQFINIQAGLWATGKLSIDKNKFVNIAGTPDEKTREAFTELFEEVVARRERGEDVTLEDLIAELQARVTPELIGDLAGGPGGGDRQVVLSDPATLIRLVENTAETLGIDRDAITDDVARAFVGAIQGAQRGMQTSGAGEVTGVSPEARVYDFLEERFGAQIERSENVAERQEGRGAFMGSVLGIDRLIGGG